jgi:ribonuclease G
MKKEWFFDRHCGLQLTALMEDGKLTEFFTERESRVGLVGDVYKGKVTNVLSGMNAVFVSCGLEKNCYLSTEETYTDYTKYDGTRVQTNEQPLQLNVGDEILVQITKPARGNKGAKVTTHLSFVGKRLIYLPNTDFLGISRKITDETQREKLLKIADAMRDKRAPNGFIVRTQAPLATHKQLKTEAEYLKKLYEEMQEKAKTAQVGDVLYQDEDLATRTVRDSFGAELVAIHVGDEKLYNQLLARIRLRGDIPERKLVRYQGERSMFSELGITPLIDAVSSPKVSLPCGGYLVLEHTEAMTVIDVNTGSFTGNNNLEETVYAVNVEAVEEIARQVRLRNVGGIIAVDFIDMISEEHKQAVTQALEERLAKDSAKCKV